MITHLEVLGKDTDNLIGFYGSVFGWKLDKNEELNYGVGTIDDNVSVGVGGAPEGNGSATFYMAVDSVAGSLAKAEELGGQKVMGPMEVPDGPTIGLFADPEGHVVGVFEPRE